MISNETVKRLAARDAERGVYDNTNDRFPVATQRALYHHAHEGHTATIKDGGARFEARANVGIDY